MNQTGVPKSPWRLAVPISSAVVAASNFRLGAFTSGWSSPFHPGPFFVSSSGGLGLQANFSCMTISKSHKTTAKGNTLRQFSRQNKVQLSCRCVSYVYVLILGIHFNIVLILYQVFIDKLFRMDVRPSIDFSKDVTNISRYTQCSFRF